MQTAVSVRNFLGNTISATLLFLSLSTVAVAEWEDVGTIATINESLDIDNCDIRIEALHANAIEHIAMSGNIQYIDNRQTLKFKIGADQLALLLSGREITSYLRNFAFVSEPKSMVLHVETNTSNNSRLFLHGVSSGTLVGYATNISDLLDNLTVQRNCQNVQEPATQITGLSATSSSVYSSYYSAIKGVDQNTSTYWVPSQYDTNKTFTVALNGSYKLDSGKITWYSGYEGTNITVLTSTNGINFNTQLPASSIVRNGAETVLSFSNTAATHVRIHINAHNQFVPILIESAFSGWAN